MIELKVAVPRTQVAEIETALERCGAQSVALLRAAETSLNLACQEVDPCLEPPPGATPLWSEVIVSGLFEDHDIDQATAFLKARFAGLAITTEPLPEQDWSRVWLEDFKPMRFGRRLWIVPSQYRPPGPQAVNVRLDPGLAFGTGTHPTTALCLEWLDGATLTGRSVIDYGCGSGILAIAALKLGARCAVALDHDPQACIATRENGRRNAIADDQLKVIDAQHIEVVLRPEPADVVLANILAGPLIGLAPRLVGLIKPGGWLVLSGLLTEQVDAVVAAYASCCTFTEPGLREGWACLAARRKL